MIIATRQCGCPPKKEAPPCSPCCTFGEKVPMELPKVRCHPPKSLKSILSRPKYREPSCCPTKPSKTAEHTRTSKIHSEIVERGLPYKEIEAIINDNKLVIRTQKEPPKQEFDPPCDCVEDPRPKISEDDVKSEETSENRTFTLFPRKDGTDDNEQTNDNEGSKDSEPLSRPVEDNPNIFKLKISKRSKNGQNIDLEFRTPRPWSRQMRLEHERRVCRMMKCDEPKEEKVDDGRIEQKRKKRRSKRKRNRLRSEEITGRPPCGKRKRDSVHC
ncbi:uncharacterized protein LOC116431496 [Nomia melanderi]|uniref:uncharacterized protein LOC116431496 n=1 Tax=Nomia melanderi TaxID=2448451 RepID=UPI003FCCCD6E